MYFLYWYYTFHILKQVSLKLFIIYNAFFLSGIFQNTDKSYLLYSVQ